MARGAFNPDGLLVGRNIGASTIALNGTLSGVPGVSSF